MNPNNSSFRGAWVQCECCGKIIPARESHTIRTGETMIFLNGGFIEETVTLCDRCISDSQKAKANC